MNIIHSENKQLSPDMTEAITDLPHLGLLRIAGAGAKQLLQGQVTCNLDEISATQSSLGMHCNPQGRILSLFRIFYYHDDYYLQMPIDILESTTLGLQKYSPFYKVELTNASTHLAKLSCYGSNTLGILKKKFQTLPEKNNSALLHNDLLIIKLPGLLPHFEIIGPAKSITDLQQHASGDSNTWKQININAGIPSIYASTIGKLLPHEINLQHLDAISFNKGCYTGQEIIARMHYRGQLKKHMYKASVQMKTCPEVGADIYNETGAAGMIVDSCEESPGNFHLLILASQADANHQKIFLTPEMNQPLKILELPYAL